MEFTLSSKAKCSQNVIFIEQKGRLSQSNSSEKSGTFMCLLNSVLSTPCLKGKGIIETNSYLSRALLKTD
jgi:hypothetical protein